MTTYTVAEVLGERPWSTNDGNSFVDHTLQLAEEEKQVRLTQKPDTPAPKVGDKLELTLSPFPQEQIDRYAPLAAMLKAKKVPQGGGGWGGGGGGGGARTDDPKTARSIARQSANKLAWDMAAFAIEHNLDEETIARMTGLQSRFANALYASVIKAQEGES